MKNTNLKIIALILALLCLLSSCTAGNNNAEETTKAPETENTLSSAPETEYEEEIDETETETETETQPAEVLIGDQSENENYKQITARDIHQYKYIHFFTEKTGEVLCLEVSSEWTVKKVTSSTYTISRDGNEIGNVFIGQSSDFNEWQTVSKEESDTKNFNITQCIDK